jgi:pilus assembly protein CpaD
MIGSARKDRMNMARLKTSAALLALGVSVGACGPLTNGLTPASNPSLYSINQPVVERTDYALDVNAYGGVSDPELQRLSAWFDSLQLTYGDRVAIAGSADPQTRGDIARLAASYGILLSAEPALSAAALQPGVVRVVVSRNGAYVPGCPIHEERQIYSPNKTSSNYGCAVNSNLASMIADPNDLVLGQVGSGDGNAATASKAIKTYRDKPATGVRNLKEVRTQ